MLMELITHTLAPESGGEKRDRWPACLHILGVRLIVGDVNHIARGQEKGVQLTVGQQKMKILPALTRCLKCAYFP